MYFEDIDLCRRIQDLGYSIHYNSDLAIIHYGGVSAKKNILRILVEYRRSQIYFTRKYYGRMGVAALKAMLLAKYGLNFIRWGLTFIGDSLFKRRSVDSFAKLLLSKKTIELVFQSAAPDPGVKNVPSRS